MNPMGSKEQYSYGSYTENQREEPSTNPTGSTQEDSSTRTEESPEMKSLRQRVRELTEKVSRLSEVIRNLNTGGSDNGVNTEIQTLRAEITLLNTLLSQNNTTLTTFQNSDTILRNKLTEAENKIKGYQDAEAENLRKNSEVKGNANAALAANQAAQKSTIMHSVSALIVGLVLGVLVMKLKG